MHLWSQKLQLFALLLPGFHTTYLLSFSKKARSPEHRFTSPHLNTIAFSLAYWTVMHTYSFLLVFIRGECMPKLISDNNKKSSLSIKLLYQIFARPLPAPQLSSCLSHGKFSNYFIAKIAAIWVSIPTSPVASFLLNSPSTKFFFSYYPRPKSGFSFWLIEENLLFSSYFIPTFIFIFLLHIVNLLNPCLPPRIVLVRLKSTAVFD